MSGNGGGEDRFQPIDQNNNLFDNVSESALSSLMSEGVEDVEINYTGFRATMNDPQSGIGYYQIKDMYDRWISSIEILSESYSLSWGTWQKPPSGTTSWGPDWTNNQPHKAEIVYKFEAIGGSSTDFYITNTEFPTKHLGRWGGTNWDQYWTTTDPHMRIEVSPNDSTKWTIKILGVDNVNNNPPVPTTYRAYAHDNGSSSEGLRYGEFYFETLAAKSGWPPLVNDNQCDYSLNEIIINPISNPSLSSYQEVSVYKAEAHHVNNNTEIDNQNNTATYQITEEGFYIVYNSKLYKLTVNPFNYIAKALNLGVTNDAINNIKDGIPSVPSSGKVLLSNDLVTNLKNNILGTVNEKRNKRTTLLKILFNENNLLKKMTKLKPSDLKLPASFTKSEVDVIKSGETIDLIEYNKSSNGFYCPLSNSENIKFTLDN